MVTRLKAAGSPNVQRLRADAAVEVKLEAAAGEGGAKRQPTFSIQAYNGGTFRPAYPYLEYPVVIDLAGLKTSGEIAILLDHVDNWIVGQSTSVRIGAGNVEVDGIVTGDWEDKEDPAGKVVQHAQRGFKWKASVGVEIQRIEKVSAGETVQVNGREFAGPLYVTRAGTLDEVSFVSVGADKTASAKVAAAAAKGKTMDFHEWLKAKGFDPETLKDEQRDTLLKAFKTEQAELRAASAGGGGTAGDEGGQSAATATLTAAAVGDDGVSSVLAPIRERNRNQERILAKVRDYAMQSPGNIEFIEATGRVAIKENWTLERLELELIRGARNFPNNNQPRGSDAPLPDQEVLEAAFAKAAGLREIEKHYHERTLSAADRRFRHGLSVTPLLVMAARNNHNADLTPRDTNELLHAAFQRPYGMRAAAGPSMINVSGILSNVANKFVVQYFNSVEQAWRMISAIGRVSDFKTITSYALTDDMEYEEVGPTGELAHGNLDEAEYTNRARTYGKILAIDRRAIINDDMRAFATVTKRIGRGGALKLNDVFWTIFLNNAAFFKTDNKNYKAGANTAFSIEALALMEQMFLEQTDPNGKPLGVSMKKVLVPPALKYAALRVLQSVEVRDVQDTAAGAGTVRTYGTSNPFSGRFDVVSSQYMSNSKYTGNSNKAWYGLADPEEVPVIETCFLNGVQIPTVDSSDADFDLLGVKFRGYHDFGVALQEPRGGTKFKGEA